ncbi:MAG: hypothetical protein EAZ85_06025 [Bacteroidetes bacterium]|nr:MAG: hypothetical protein EAZ85_06025 [Bacteroidota bacterium]TAG89800.1 MAG: hypothetical protein EAZ20_05660 [Bacteroidota bacterium]
MENQLELVEYKEIGDKEMQCFYNGNLFCSCVYEPQNNLSISTWIGYTPQNIIIDAYTNIGYFAAKNQWHVIKNITDLSQSEGSFHEITEWFLTNYVPKMVKRGFKYSAVIKSDDLFVQLATEFQLELKQDLYITQIFDSYEQGYEWVTKLV